VGDKMQKNKGLKT